MTQPSSHRGIILVVDDETHSCLVISEFLQSLGYQTETAPNGADALEKIRKGTQDFHLVLTDLSMPKKDGLTLLKEARESHPHLDFMLMTANGTLETAIQALRAGAYDYILKPVEFDDLSLRLEKLEELRRLQSRTELLERENKTLRGTGRLESLNNKTQKIFEEAQRVAQTDASVLLLGETGVGKEVLARYIHESSPRKKGPFVAVNCSAIPDNLMESEFFGHEKGAFTGADRRTNGFFHQAHGGTLFLDEIGEMDLKLQPKILRALEERKVRRVGANSDQEVDIRLVSATHQGLEGLIAEKRFREDLFFRINVIRMEIPPLRKRKEDIPVLVKLFAERFSTKLNTPIKSIDPSFIEALEKHDFPGNIRELSNLLERAMIYAKDGILTANTLPENFAKERKETQATSFPPGKSLQEILQDFERKVILDSLDAMDQDVDSVAKNLQVSRSTLYSKITKLRIK